MLVELEQKEDVCILRLKGRCVTGADTEYLRGKTDEIKSRNCGKVLADFRQVPYIDSSGIAFVVAIYTSVTKSAGGRFVLVGPQPLVREVLDLTRLSTVIPLAEDIAAGLAELDGPAARSV